MRPPRTMAGPEMKRLPMTPQPALAAARAARLVAAPLLVALLAGCGSLAPTLERPPLPVAPSYPGAQAATGDAAARSAAADIAWADFFTDARTQRLVGIALEQNRDLRVAVLNIERTRAQYGVQRADRWPTLNAAATATRQPNGAGGTTSFYNAGLSVSGYELDLFGRVRNLSEAAFARYLATEEGRKSAQMSLIASVVQLELALRADDELLALTRQTLGTRDDSLRLIQVMLDNGAASELDLRQAQSLVESARVTLAQLQRQRALDENALVLLLGQPLPADLPAAPPLDDTLLATDLPAGLPSDLLERRPDIRAAEQQLVAANASIGAARAAFFPRITLTAGLGFASTHLSDLFSDGGGAWTFSPQIVLPIFDGGRNRANLDVARTDQRIAVADYEKAVQTAFREVADALAGRETLLDQTRAQQAQIDAESARFRLADLRYRNGVSSYLDLLDAQRSLFAAQQAGVQARLVRLQNQVALYQALGGGWQEPPAGTAAANPAPASTPTR